MEQGTSHTAQRMRAKRVEYEKGWGWIARKKDGTEIVPDFVWSSRSVARTVVAEYDMMNPAPPR